MRIFLREEKEFARSVGRPRTGRGENLARFSFYSQHHHLDSEDTTFGIR
jgi:hypothetical protein